MASLARRRFHPKTAHLSTVHKKAESAERRMACAAAGALIGFLENKGKLPTSFASVPTKLAMGVGFTIMQMQSRGSTSRLAGAMADASFATYAYAAAKSGAFIAGGEEVGDDD